ncbi:DUF99 family protein [Candidatus Woesearchaeota archaeon]|nr:DUF99 family protein [Candidatus Woesearchaeota archaeon]
MIKKEARILGIDDSPFDKFRDREVLIIGTFFRGGSSLDGVMTTTAAVDGSDATAKIIRMVKKSKFFPQLQAIMLNGIAVGGFNVIDIQKLRSATKIPVVVVMRDFPEVGKIKGTLASLGMEAKVKLIEKAGRIYKVDNVHVQLSGCSLERARELLKISCTRSNIPEPVRVAHLIAAGIKLGESKGKA